MTYDDIIRIARKAGWSGIYTKPLFSITMQEDDFLRFAALVAAAEREAIEDIILDYAERDDLSDSDESLLKHLFELIRARGEI